MDPPAPSPPPETPPTWALLGDPSKQFNYCPFSQDGVCLAGTECPYKHLLHHVTPICQDFAQGRCPFGKACPNFHRPLHEPASIRLRVVENELSVIDGFLESRESAERFLNDKATWLKHPWLDELGRLGLSESEITDLLVDGSQQGPWVFSPCALPPGPSALSLEPFEIPSPTHLPYCVHDIPGRDYQREGEGQDQKDNTENQTNAEDFLTIHDRIGRLCGLGGVRPVSSGEPHLEYGHVEFKCDDSTAIVSLHDDDWNDSCQEVLHNLLTAAKMLHDAGGCCDSFSLLVLQAHTADTARVADAAALRKVHFSTILSLIDGLNKMSLGLKRSPIHPEAVREIKQLFGDAGDHLEMPLHLFVQVVSLALLLYSRSHCGPLSLPFLDGPLSHIILMDSEWRFQGPCVDCSLERLSCFGDMLQQPVFVFRYIEPFYANRYTFWHPKERLDLIASPEEILDTWGPGRFVTERMNGYSLYAVELGGGFLTRPSPQDEGTGYLHWERTLVLPERMPWKTFARTAKMRIGTQVAVNTDCRRQPLVSRYPLQELGTFPSYYEVAERQVGFGLQGGASGAVGILQFNQAWIKRPGVSKKAKLLSQKSLFIGDLEALWGVQVSLCTGIARRVQLRQLLADTIPVYVQALITKPRHWGALVDSGLVHVLRHGHLRPWLENLDQHLQITLENIIFSVLFLLQDTGIDRDGENFLVAFMQEHTPSQCFKLSCKPDNLWTRVLADSMDCVTFAYATSECLQTQDIQCHNPNVPPSSVRGETGYSAALLETAVYYLAPPNPTPTADTGTTRRSPLIHKESYIIGHMDLIVQVEHPPNTLQDPRLVVHQSAIPDRIWRRFLLSSKGGGVRRKLRERRDFQSPGVDVTVQTA